MRPPDPVLWLLCATAVCVCPAQGGRKEFLVTEHLPDLETFLKAEGLDRFHGRFLDQGVHSMQYLLRLKPRDVQIWGMDWGMPLDDIRRLSRRIAELTVVRVVEEEEEDPLLRLRNSLHHGKLSLRHGVAAYPFHKAFFGGDLPHDELELRMADPPCACQPPKDPESLRNALVVALRGNCSFLDKARSLVAAEPAALVLLNSDNQLFRLSAGAITDTKDDPNANSGIAFAVGLLTHEAASVVRGALGRSEPVFGRLVPLQCKGPDCAPVLPAEKAVVPYVDSGSLVGDGLEPVEFLTSTFGMPLPEVALALVRPGDASGCSYLVADEELPSSPFQGAWVLLERGNCSFGDKAFYAQEAGARGVIIQNRPHELLARFATTRQDVFIPGVIISQEAGARLRTWMGDAEPRMIEVQPRPGAAELWQSLAAETWPRTASQLEVLRKRLLRAHAESAERRRWIEDAVERWVAELSA